MKKTINNSVFRSAPPVKQSTAQTGHTPPHGIAYTPAGKNNPIKPLISPPGVFSYPESDTARAWKAGQ
jgi:hypothetical protein